MRRLHFVWAACLCGMVQALPHPQKEVPHPQNEVKVEPRPHQGERVEPHPHQGGNVEPRPQEGEKEEDVEDQTEDPADLVGLVGGKRFFVFLTVHHHSVGVFAGNFLGGTYEKRVAYGIHSKLFLFFATDS